MDTLIKIVQEHEEYIKLMSLINKSLKAIADDEGATLLEGLKEFSDEYLVGHFEFEENEYFPTLLKIGTPEEKHLIRELQMEHNLILGWISQFNDLYSSDGPHSKDPVKISEMYNYTRKIAGRVIQHARREDSELIPVLKKYENNFL